MYNNLHNAYAIIALIIAFICIPNNTYGYSECDTVRNCIGRDLQLSVTNGKGAHYIDIDKTSELNKISSQMTVEFWAKISRQANRTQYIAGLWGPGNDKQDSWVIYIDKQDSLCFEINGGDEALGELDNTVVKIPAAPFYDRWEHFSFVFNGNTGYLSIYTNGTIKAIKRNDLYPAKSLKKINNPELSIQIGSTNALSNDIDNNRTMLGFIDEIRIWGRALLQSEINCQKEIALNGDEDSLLVYYRCNIPDDYNLCDASGHNNIGRLRSGIKVNWSSRDVTQKVIYSPAVINDTIICDVSKTYNFTLTDTNECSTGAYVRVIGDNSDVFSIRYNSIDYEQSKWVYLKLPRQIPVPFSVTFNSDLIGKINPTLQIRNENACGWEIANIPLNITRYTELLTTTFALNFDSLKARCVEKPYIDSTITITNITHTTATPHIMTISKIESSMPEVFEVSMPALPYTLIPNNSFDLNVRFHSKDTNAFYYADLFILSNDKCEDTIRIGMSGKVREVIKLQNTLDGSNLDTIDFGRTCINFPSMATQYLWENSVETNIVIDSIIIPEHFLGKPFKFPVILTPVTGYMANYFRFLPTAPGVFNDSIIFLIKSEGCTIKRPVYVKGTGYFADISFVDAEVDFGTIKVGQESTVNVRLKNNSNEDVRVSIYLKRGIPFYINGNKSVNIPANSTTNFNLTFIPTDTQLHLDEICIYENSCFQADCIPVKGKAYIDLFEYIPEMTKIENVLACENKDGILTIKNASGVIQTLSEFSLVQPTDNPFSLVAPTTLPTSLQLTPDQEYSFTFNYFTNDLTKDRVDYAYLYYKTADGQRWSGKLYGSSIIPKLYLTEELLFETIEVGASIFDTVRIENISNYQISVDSLAVGNGFSIIYPLSGFPKALQAKDTMMVILKFTPTEEKVYTSNLQVFSKSPCVQELNTYIEGRAIIVPLDAPLKVISYGFVPPCNCLQRVIPLINNSNYFDMSIDSVWIDDVDVFNPFPEYFSWKSFYSPSGSVPYSIPKRSTDTLTITYCPKSTFTVGFLDNDGRIHIKASGNLWNREFTTYLSGKQTMMFSADRASINFPPTRVDTFATSELVTLRIPTIQFNPKRTTIRIDSIEFEPDERVFSVANNLGTQFPITVDSLNELTLKVDFKPRAVRDYEAKLKIYLSGDCYHADTTIALSGSGYAPAFGLDFNFKNNHILPDTFKTANCKPITIPMISSRTLPANSADIFFKLHCDTNKLKLINVDSPYLQDSCPNLIPNVSYTYLDAQTMSFKLKNFCKVDSLTEFINFTFMPATDRDTFVISIDSIKFDTEEVILYHLIAEGDRAVFITLKPELTILDSISINSLQVLDCRLDTLTIQNTGDIELSAFDVVESLKELNIKNYYPANSGFVLPGDSILIEFEYCPRKKRLLDSLIEVVSTNPCPIADTTGLYLMAYAPRFDAIYSSDYQYNVPDSINYSIGDTVTIPVIAPKAFAATINSKYYILEDLSFNINVGYRPQVFKFIQADNYLVSDFSYTEPFHGNVLLQFDNTLKVDSGKIADLKFLAIVPDTIHNLMYFSSSDYATDSIMFLDIYPAVNSIALSSSEKCGLTFLKNSSIADLKQNVPNPWSNNTKIEFSIREDAPVTLKLYEPSGELVKVLINEQLKPGQYELILDTSGLDSGMYFYVISSGVFTDIRQMILIK